MSIDINDSENNPLKEGSETIFGKNSFVDPEE